jgi:hypothetical protein
VGWTTKVSNPCEGSGAHPAFYLIGTGGDFPGVKRSRREDDHPSSCSALKA